MEDQIEVNWSEPREGQQGKKVIPIEFASIPGHKERFVLFQTDSHMIATMWTLWDQTTETKHFLFGNGWEGARASAVECIQRVMTEIPKPPKPRRARFKK